MQLSAPFTAFPFPSYFHHSVPLLMNISRPPITSPPQTTADPKLLQKHQLPKNKSKKQTIYKLCTSTSNFFAFIYISLSLSLLYLLAFLFACLLARFLLKALRRRREKRGCWTTLRVVPPADEHGDAAAHDVEPGPLFFYEAGAPAREGPRRARTRFPLSHARGSLEEGPAFAHHHPPARAAAAIPAPLLRKLPFLVHVQLHRSPYLPPPASPLDRLILWIRGMDLVKKESERVGKERVKRSGVGLCLCGWMR